VKTLIIVRHAKSSWDNLDLKDIERPLNDRGEKDAPRMAKRLKEREITPDLLLSSPAVRAIETCRHIAKVLEYPLGKVKTEPRLYHADEDTLLLIVKELKDHDTCVMLFGHNPGLTIFTNLLLKEDIDTIPTCGIVSASLNVSSWSAVKFGCGRLDFYDYPKRNLRE
jgi:phosphohistidine phosphatase